MVPETVSSKPLRDSIGVYLRRTCGPPGIGGRPVFNYASSSGSRSLKTRWFYLHLIPAELIGKPTPLSEQHQLLSLRPIVPLGMAGKILTARVIRYPRMFPSEALDR